MPKEREHVEGWVVDLICIRHSSVAETLAAARGHTRACALMGHCIESGFGLIQPSGQVTPLDPDATPLVVDALRKSPRTAGIFLRAERERDGRDMSTVRIREIPVARGTRALAAHKRHRA